MNKAQEFIRIKRRKRRLKRLSMLAIILVTAIIFFIYKSPIFNVNKIIFTGVEAVNEDELQNSLKDYIGKNIFILNKKGIREKILENPYIKEVEVNKKGINTLEILIEEGKVVYYIEQEGGYKAITNDGFYVEKLETLEVKDMVKVVGVKDNGKNIGEKIVDDENIIKILNEFNPILKSEHSEFRVEKLDLTDVLNLKGYINEIEILFGDYEDLLGKMNKVLNILEQSKMKKGYIDVSFNGPAVIKVEA